MVIDSEGCCWPKELKKQRKRSKEEFEAVLEVEGKRMRPVGGGGDEQAEKSRNAATTTTLGFKKIIWQSKGEVLGISKSKICDTDDEEAVAMKEKKKKKKLEMEEEGSRKLKPQITNRAGRTSTAVISVADGRSRSRSSSAPSPNGGTSSIVRELLLQMGANDQPGRALRKMIKRSDIDKGQHRLLLPKDGLDKAMLEGKMTAAEKMKTTEKNGLAVKTLDQLGREYSLVLRFVASVNAYRIAGPDYMKLVQANGFQVGHFVDLWVFRGVHGLRQDSSGIGIVHASGERSSAMSNIDAEDELMMAIDYDDHDKKAEEELIDQEMKMAVVDHQGCNCCVSAGEGCRQQSQGGVTRLSEASCRVVDLDDDDDDEEELMEVARALLMLRQQGGEGVLEN